jgi:hypothetical protein
VPAANLLSREPVSAAAGGCPSAEPTRDATL